MSESQTSAPARDLVVTVNGILTGRSNWMERIRERREIKTGFAHVDGSHWEWPLPRLAWLRNRRRTARLYDKINQIYVRDWQLGRIHIIGHSNGCLIALQLARLLACFPCRTLGSLQLIAPALPASPTTRIVSKLIADGHLNRAVLYRAANDRALALTQLVGGVLTWPWGSLGRTGWRIDEATSPLRGMETVEGYDGHSHGLAGARPTGAELRAEDEFFDGLIEVIQQARAPYPSE